VSVPAQAPPPLELPPWAIVVIVVYATAAVGLSGVALYLALPGATGGCGPFQPGCPAGWGVAPESNVTPGSEGCGDRPAETCFAALLESNTPNMELSDFWFEILGPPTNASNVLSGPPVAMGPSAGVSAFVGNGPEVGVWNWTSANWTHGGGWTIPENENVNLVLDTGFENASLVGDMFWTFIVSTHRGEGFPVCDFNPQSCQQVVPGDGPNPSAIAP
jgi:hypothetical protein